MNELLISNSGLRFFVVVLLVTTFALMNSVNTVEAKPVANRPNIILIMADDMGWSDIGCYGGEANPPTSEPRVVFHSVLQQRQMHDNSCFDLNGVIST